MDRFAPSRWTLQGPEPIGKFILVVEEQTLVGTGGYNQFFI